MQAVMDQVACMTDGTSDVDVAGASRADRAMEQYACGDEAAFAELYDELAPRLYRFALRWTRSRSAAEDTVQQTLLQIHAARHRFVRGSAVHALGLRHRPPTAHQSRPPRRARRAARS